MGSLQFGTFAGIPGELLEAPGGICFTGSSVSLSRMRLSFCPGGKHAFFRIFYQVAFIVIWNPLLCDSVAALAGSKNVRCVGFRLHVKS